MGTSNCPHFSLHGTYKWTIIDQLLVVGVTPQNVIAAKCNTNTKCNNINAKCNKIVNAKCNNFPTQNVLTFLTQIVITPELQLCST